jgi:hypothetical protein
MLEAPAAPVAAMIALCTNERRNGQIGSNPAETRSTSSCESHTETRCQNLGARAFSEIADDPANRSASDMDASHRHRPNASTSHQESEYREPGSAHALLPDASRARQLSAV